MARPASVISPQWSNPIVTRGLANLLLSCEMRSRHEASMPARPPLSLRKGENGNPPHTDVQDALSSPPTFSFEAYFFLSSSSKTKRGLVYQLNRLNDELRRESFRELVIRFEIFLFFQFSNNRGIRLINRSKSEIHSLLNIRIFEYYFSRSTVSITSFQ